MPHPIQYFQDQVHQNQLTILPGLKQPLVSRLAILTLSRPVKSVSESIILEFFGTFWLHTSQDIMHGYFASESEAVAYAQSSYPEAVDEVAAGQELDS